MSLAARLGPERASPRQKMATGVVSSGFWMKTVVALRIASFSVSSVVQRASGDSLLRMPRIARQWLVAFGRLAYASGAFA